MADALKLSEISVLLALMAEAREVSNVDLAERYRFTLTGESRQRLNDRKLVGSRRVGRSYVHELTDAGWARCLEELSGPCPPRAGTAGGALYALMHGLHRYLGRAQLSLADVFRPLSEREEPSVSEARQPARGTRQGESTVDPEQAVRAAYVRLPRQPGGWVALADLRADLATTPRSALDDALARMSRQAGVSLVPGENHKTLTDEDRAAAVTVGGRPYHFLLIEDV